MKPSGWFVRRNDNNMLKCTDGKWRHNARAVENIKIWKHSGNAIRYGQRGVPDMGELGGIEFAKVTAHAVYDDEEINCLGYKVERLAEGVEKQEVSWEELTNNN